MTVIVDRRLFLTADKDRLVAPDDPAAAFLWAVEGDEVSDEDAAALGYTGGVKQADAKQAAPVEDKAIDAPDADKAPAKPARRTRKSSK